MEGAQRKESKNLSAALERKKGKQRERLPAPRPFYQQEAKDSI